jgi:hypothetical protein
VEIMGFLPESDFNLAHPKLLIASLEREKLTKINLKPGIIQRFIYEDKDDPQKELKKSLRRLGFLRLFHECMYGLYFSNTLIRCF